MERQADEASSRGIKTTTAGSFSLFDSCRPSATLPSENGERSEGVGLLRGESLRATL